MFLDPTSFKGTSSYSMDHFREWSNQVASQFFTAGDDPTEGIVKIAKEMGFVPHQIETLSAEVNKFIHQRKYASAEDKYHAADFPLADAKKAIAALQADGGEVKIAVSLPEPKFSRSEDDPTEFYKMFGVTPEQIDKTASVKHEIKNTFQKTALLKQKTQDKEILDKYAAEAAESNFIKTARKMLIGEPSSADRFRILGEIDHFCKSAGMADVAKKPLAKLAYAMMREGMIEPSRAKPAMEYFLAKEADEKAPQEWISPTLKAKIVNGKHPLYITLKTLKDTGSAYDLSKDRYQLVDDKLQILGQKVRAL